MLVVSALLADSGAFGVGSVGLRNASLTDGDTVTLGLGALGGYGTVWSVNVLDQSAHPYAQASGFAVVESAAGAVPPGTLLSAETLNQLLESQPTAAGGVTSLQVRGVALTGGSVRVRFNQPVDLARLAKQSEPGAALRSSQIIILRGNETVRGVLLPDPDGAGFSFIPDGGALPRGDYTVLLRSGANGFVNLRGEWLDGDYDGRAGGDYRARFTIETSPSLLVRGADPSLPDALPQHDTGTTFVADPSDAAAWDTDALWNTLLGGVGGASMLAASLGPWGLAVPARRASRRPPAAAQRKAPPGDAAAIRVRTRALAPEVVGAPTPTPLASRSPAWLVSWLDRPGARGNDWKIRL